MAIEEIFERINSNNNETFCERLKNDPHWEDIDCEILETEDIAFLEKFISGKLEEKEIDERLNNLEKSGLSAEDTSYALAAMLKNKLLGQEGFKRHEMREREMERKKQRKQPSTEETTTA